VLSRVHDGHGRTSKLSIFESSIAVSEYIMFEASLRRGGGGGVGGDIMRRIGVNRFWPTFPVGIYRTKQGWLGVTTVTPAQWRAFCEMLGLFDCAMMRRCFLASTGSSTWKKSKQIWSEVEAAHRAGVVCEGLKRRIPIVPVLGIGDLIRDEEKRSRERLYRLPSAARSALPRLHAAIDRHAATARRSSSAIGERSPSRSAS